MAADSIARPFLTAAEVGPMLGLSADQVRGRAEAGLIPGTRRGKGGTWTFKRAEIEAIVNGQPAGEIQALITALAGYTAVVARLCNLIEERTDVRVPIRQSGR